MHNLFKNVEPIRLKVDGSNFTKAAGTGDTLNSESVDTQGANVVALVWTFGAVVNGGAGTIKAQQSSDDAVADAFADIEGSKQTILDADDDKMRIIEIFHPQERYIRGVTIRATQNLTLDALHAYLARPEHAPITEGATVAGSEFFNSPAEGTA